MSDPTLKATICPHCGSPAAPGEAFCRNCGKQLFAPTITAPPPAIPPLQPKPFTPPPLKKRRSKLMMGCLIFIGLVFVAAGAGGIYIWRLTSYTPPVRKAPDIPQRAAGTLTEFPVDNDPNTPAQPTSAHTESLTGDTAKAEGYSPTKLPPGIDRSKLAKGATTMTSATYKPKPKGSTPPPASTKDEIYICVLVAMPNQPGFVDGLTASVTQATVGQKTGVKVQSPKGATYVGSTIRSPQGSVYVLGKQGADIVILIFSPEASMQSIVDRLAQNVGNGEGLNDYPEVKDALWTLPASTPSDLTLLDISTLTRAQIESSLVSTGYDKETKGPARPAGAWTSIGTADCSGKDIGQSVGSAQPDPARCTTSGTIAICWDGNQYRNPGRSGAWCTYKNTGGSRCTGGSNPGFAYQCQASTAGSAVAGNAPSKDTSDDEAQRILSLMRPFIPERLSSARYRDAGKQEWVAQEYEYGSSFQAWRTWLLARGALGLGGAQTVMVREVSGVYLDSEGRRLLVFQKGPYLIFLSSPSAATTDRLVALGNQFQV